MFQALQALQTAHQFAVATAAATHDTASHCGQHNQQKDQTACTVMMPAGVVPAMVPAALIVVIIVIIVIIIIMVAIELIVHELLVTTVHARRAWRPRSKLEDSSSHGLEGSDRGRT
eukprot:TRINITY_DN25823_c0_g1_i1.p9 TRINITY_DN25823_c0_g1~~TRINITY_DN25823_c0_g1_i1.p9  ORF type:complete len:116 (-),score=25.93 TRINITY_DN25823_c0_g1_i1:1847-2194(-)